MRKYFIDQSSEPSWKKTFSVHSWRKKNRRELLVEKKNQAAELLQGQGHIVSESEHGKSVITSSFDPFFSNTGHDSQLLVRNFWEFSKNYETVINFEDGRIAN